MRIGIISSIVVPMPPGVFFFFLFLHPPPHSRARCDVPPTKRRTLCGYIYTANGVKRHKLLRKKTSIVSVGCYVYKYLYTVFELFAHTKSAPRLRDA